MRLERVTITGIDDGVDREWIDEMTSEFSLVEWGVLLSESPNRKGSARYPSDRWLAELTDTFSTKYDDHFSAHLCGSLSDKIILDGGKTYLTGELVEHSLPGFFSRIQLNSYPDRDFGYPLINALASNLTGYAEIILPIPNEMILQRVQHNFLQNVNFMHDPSRGQGIPTKDWPRANSEHFVGFAGGIGPDNVREVLEMLTARDDERYFWIDMETRVRTDDQLDRKKVEVVLNIAKEFI